MKIPLLRRKATRSAHGSSPKSVKISRKNLLMMVFIGEETRKLVYGGGFDIVLLDIAIPGRENIDIIKDQCAAIRPHARLRREPKVRSIGLSIVSRRTPRQK